jgi:hypothetical protein
MAVMDALLRIKAAVTGEDQISGLGRALGGLNKTAGSVTGGLKGIGGATGGLLGPLSALTGLLSGAGLVAMAKGAIDAADNMNDLSQKTGVSVEQLSRFEQAANMSGATIEDVGKALTRLAVNVSKSVADSADAAGESAEEIKERVKRETDEAVEVVKRNADRQVDAIKEGERKQLDAVKDNGDKRIAAIERESDARMSELNRRYRQEEKLLNDKYEDEADRQEEAADDEQKQLERQTEKRYETRIEAIQEDNSLDKQYKKQLIENLQEQRDAELEAIRDRYEEAAKLRRRALRDQEEEARDALDRRKKSEEDQLKGIYEGQKEIVEKGVEAQRSAIEKSAAASAEAVKAAADKATDALKQSAGAPGELSEEMEELGLSGKGASKAFAELGIALTDSAGKMRPLDQIMLDLADRFSQMPDGGRKVELANAIAGKSMVKLIPMLNGGRESIERLKALMGTDFAQAADGFNDKMNGVGVQMQILGVSVATKLMPALNMLADAVIAVADVFGKMPGWLQASVLIVGGLTLAFLALAPAIAATTTLLGGLAAWFSGTAIAATIAGWAPAIIGAFTTVLAWFTGTLVPGLLFIFGPAGLIFLAIAALVAVIVGVKFREPILKFLGWVGETVVNAMKLLLQGAYTVLAKPWVDLFNVVMRAPITGMIDWLKATWNNAIGYIGNALRAVANAAQRPFLAVIDIIRSLFNSLMGFIARGVNGAISAINVVIAGYNRIPFAPKISPLDQIPVPQFAEGGVVDRPTLAMVGEGGEREYIIPESKMAGASAAYLAGTRGAGVITGTAGPAVINITTGPVLQQDGQQWVTTRDLERAMRATEAGTLARIRTPAGRSALGIR